MAHDVIAKQNISIKERGKLLKLTTCTRKVKLVLGNRLLCVWHWPWVKYDKGQPVGSLWPTGSEPTSSNMWAFYCRSTRLETALLIFLK